MDGIVSHISTLQQISRKGGSFIKTTFSVFFLSHWRGFHNQSIVADAMQQRKEKGNGTLCYTQKMCSGASFS